MSDIKSILLNHKGKSNAITAKEVSRLMGFPLEDTQSASRRAIWDTAKQHGLPLVSSTKGYYIATNKEEIAEYNAEIQKRINGMELTRKAANENFHKWYENS